MNILAKPQHDMLLLDDLVTTSVDTTSFPDEIFIYARPRDRDDQCGKCGSDEHPVHGHGYVEGRFKDVNAIGKKSTIVVKRQRYKCTGCGTTWVQRTGSLHERRMLSRRLERFIWDSCFRSTFIDVARDHGIDEGTVRNIFNDLSKSLKKCALGSRR